MSEGILKLKALEAIRQRGSVSRRTAMTFAWAAKSHPGRVLLVPD
jgi:hypothetical protein